MAVEAAGLCEHLEVAEDPGLHGPVGALRPVEGEIERIHVGLCGLDEDGEGGSGEHRDWHGVLLSLGVVMRVVAGAGVAPARSLWSGLSVGSSLLSFQCARAARAVGVLSVPLLSVPL